MVTEKYSKLYMTMPFAIKVFEISGDNFTHLRTGFGNVNVAQKLKMLMVVWSNL